MNKSGQIILVLISVLFTAYQKILAYKPFFTIDFFIFTLIAWLVGWQYDRVRYYVKKARANEDSYKQMIDSLPHKKTQGSQAFFPLTIAIQRFNEGKGNKSSIEAVRVCMI
ncbi:hypothetical protein [Bacillus sp. V2I10]|uniref:hypothetical protein n=1 Tax=Bacillus sp. V2I10 TaxID=3042276 RepID=UPI0027851E25|nr:hypothetical protein [Bacillus sp. V2I10]MDQ0858968.1 hypothetical protein [Bacillus sp. V2I10]